MSRPDKQEKKDSQETPDHLRKHQGGPTSSKGKVEKHRKDDSDGADNNTTKKQSNAI